MRDSLREDDLYRLLGRPAAPARMDETVRLCVQLMREKTAHEEPRLGFWGFLSGVFRFTGIPMLTAQAGVLALACLAACSSSGDPRQLPAYMPLFILAVLPVFFQGQYHRVSELEAATRSSGAQLALAKLVLAGAGTLVCVSVLLGVEISLQRSWQALGRMLLYCLVPYLVCMSAVLFLIRKRRRDSIPVCAAAAAGSFAFWAISAKHLPRLYEASAAGIWSVALLVFSCFFARELAYIIRADREGRMYGIVDR